jgi:predicted phage-related endonuclease
MPMMQGVSQQTGEWLQARIGCVTASRVADIVTRLKSKKGPDGELAYSADRQKYKKELIYENMTNLSLGHWVSPAMDWGSENEPLAKAAYEMEADVELQDGGFWLHDEIPRFGASPDALVGEFGLLECKCPPSGHLDILQSRVIPVEYEPQMLAQMACTGRQWCDFVSFNPDFPKQHRIFIKRFHRDEARITELQNEVMKFLMEVVQAINALEEIKCTLAE